MSRQIVKTSFVKENYSLKTSALLLTFDKTQHFPSLRIYATKIKQAARKQTIIPLQEFQMASPVNAGLQL